MASSKDSKHYRFRQVEYWASRGRVYLLDLAAAGDSDKHVLEKVRTISPGELLQRAIAIRMFADDRYPNEVYEARKFLEEAQVVAKWAKFQGDPTNPKVLEHIAKHKRNNRIVVPDGRLSLPAMPQASYKLQRGEAKDILLNGVNVVPQIIPDVVIPQSRMLTPQRAAQMRRRG